MLIKPSVVWEYHNELVYGVLEQRAFLREYLKIILILNTILRGIEYFIELAHLRRIETNLRQKLIDSK